MRGVPINALSTARPARSSSARWSLTDRVRSAPTITPVEADGFNLIWRYASRVPVDLLGETAEEQAVLNARILPLAFNPA